MVPGFPHKHKILMDNTMSEGLPQSSWLGGFVKKGNRYIADNDSLGDIGLSQVEGAKH